MLRVHKYTCRSTGKETIQCHEYRHNKLIKSYAKCSIDLLPVLIKGHDIVEMVNVHKMTDLKINIIKNTKCN